MSICSGCRSIRYCCKEHQVAHWMEHRTLCKVQQKYHEAARAEAGHSEHTNGLPSAEERIYLIEDWVELYRMAIEEALAWALHDLSTPYDFREQFALFLLEYRRECEGNPALAFEVRFAGLQNVPHVGTPFDETFSAFLPILEALHEKSRTKADGTYMSVIHCLYFIDTEIRWMQPSVIYTLYLNPGRPRNQPFYHVLQASARSGLVWRNHKDICWVPGLLSKHPSGIKWVWKEHHISELEARGIRVQWEPDSLLESDEHSDGFDFDFQ